MKVCAVCALLSILSSIHLVSTESHLLSFLATLITGETPFPELTVVLMVNNVPVAYCDSNLKKFVSRRHWRCNDTIEETDIMDFLCAEVHRSLKASSHIAAIRYNHTDGIHVCQEFAACDLEDDKLSRFFIKAAYDGEEKYQYDALSHTQNTLVPELLWGKLRKETNKLVFVNIYQPLCVRTLRRHLQEDKNILLRKVHPRVRVIQKKHPDSGRTQVSCLATGFYPRHVNMTLLRDDQPVPDQELTGGQVLPNGDGTYQLRRSLSVSEEELRERHRYTCTVSHLSVDNKLDVTWEAEAPPDTVFICVVLITVLGLAALIIITATVLWRRRHTGLQSCCGPAAGVQYSAAQTTAGRDVCGSCDVSVENLGASG